MAVEAGTVSLYLKSPENLGAAKGSIAAFFIFIFFYQFGYAQAPSLNSLRCLKASDAFWYAVSLLSEPVQ